ncbi:uncharacterized protein LOC117572420 isoform X2 [Drosophila albomicans]|uniref:Uncharacterized protein LOC117572420 isoform X2 n=1 Tax=Drosophila albomicans TaxID=7291 RepID=A0A6P8XI49_DROAB|nr:uncharacterized protein LOC117572420 isoform X2 [Drosophila albomicans]
MSNAKHCQSNTAQHSHSSRPISNRSGSRSSNSSNSSTNNNNSGNSIYLYTLLMALAALLLPLTQARHLPNQLAYNNNYNEHNNNNNNNNEDSSLPAWHVNPFYGLDMSSSDDSSSGSDSSDSSDRSDSYDSRFIDSSFEELRELRRLERMRHRRSQKLTFFVRAQHEAAQRELPTEWENPCSGTFEPADSQTAEIDSSNRGRTIKRKYLVALRNKTMWEYDEIHRTANLDYGSSEHWQHEYKFLPNMTRPTNAVKLKTWYRHMQTFVGSFAHLGKAHYRYRKQNQLSLDNSTYELHALLQSARSVLCEIENTINSSYPNSHGAKLTHISRQAMEDRLKFHTPADGSEEADLNDLKFSKLLYFQYLDNMWKTLHKSLRKQHRNSMEQQRRQQKTQATGRGNNINSLSGSNSLQAFSLESSESGSMGATRRRSPCRNSAEC